MDYKNFLEKTYGIKSSAFVEEKVILPIEIVNMLKIDFTPGDDNMNFAEHLGDLIIYGLWLYNNKKIND